jgi:hypothetical protein
VIVNNIKVQLRECLAFDAELDAGYEIAKGATNEDGTVYVDALMRSTACSPTA